MRQLTFDDIFESLQEAADNMYQAEQVEIDKETETELASKKATVSRTTIDQLNDIYDNAMQNNDYQVALSVISLKLTYDLK